jgi:molybdate transport system regulatory protein
VKPRAKLFISSDTHEGVFGEGKYQLLLAVKEHGSISKAALALGRSYRKAWGDIKKAEECLGAPLVNKVRGGTSGGASLLTDYCEEVLRAWKVHRESTYAAMEKSYQRNLQSLLDGSRNRLVVTRSRSV